MMSAGGCTSGDIGTSNVIDGTMAELPSPPRASQAAIPVAAVAARRSPTYDPTGNMRRAAPGAHPRRLRARGRSDQERTRRGAR